MKMRPLSLARHEKGAAAIEFALAAPILFTIVVGMAQVGVLFFANAGLQNAVATGARLATIFPVPTDEEIKDAVKGAEFGLKAANIVADASVVRGSENGLGYADISMSYKVPLNFLFFETPPITLTETRRVFTQEVVTIGSSTSSSSTSSTSSSTSSGSSTTGSTSTGGDVISTSTGGDLSSTSSTGSTSSGNNGNGKGNGNGSSGNK